MIRTARPTDPLYGFQWYLEAGTGPNAMAGMDLDLPRVWADYLGRSVKVAVVETTNNYVELNHPDLPQSFVRYSAEEDGRPDDFFAGSHGTAVAGIIAASWNNIGGAGIAPAAQIGSYAFRGTADAELWARAFRRADADGMHVLSNSWGGDGKSFDKNFNASTPNALLVALSDLAAQGRGGLGSIIVWANGNERMIGADGGLDGAISNRFTIAVAALENNGVVTNYSTPGANLLISAFGGGNTSQSHSRPGNAILTTDLMGRSGYNRSPSPDGDVAYGFDGTSAATPMVSAVTALMLEANPRLGYRDVHEILVDSARMPETAMRSVVENGAGDWNNGKRFYSRDTGFGVVDAHSAVRMAEALRATGATPLTEQNIQSVQATGSIIGNSASFTLPAFDVERVTLDLRMAAPNAAGLTITLQGPAVGSIALLSQPTALASVDYAAATITSLPFPTEGFTFQTPFFWGQTDGGTWQLTVSGAPANALNGATLKLWGKGTPDGTTMVFTDDLANAMQSGFISRKAISTGDQLTINAAAVSGDVVLDMRPSSIMFGNVEQIIGGVTLNSTPGLNWRNLWGGDGNDRFIGNASDNLFYGARGNNTISGGDGVDTAAYLGSRALHNVMQTATGFVAQGRDGRDTLDGVERLHFQEGRLAAGDATDGALVAAALYRTLLGRAPDRAGFDSWQATLNEAVGRDAMNITTAVQGFLGSAEFGALHGGLSNAQFVALLYQGFFGRSGDTAGAAHWEAALASGTSRPEVVRAFVLADEFQTVAMARIAEQAASWVL